MFGKHAIQGELTGNPFQSEGRHTRGITFFPLGDRERCKPEYNTEVYQELDSDRNDKLIKRFLSD